jgi:hypothetical protein
MGAAEGSGMNSSSFRSAAPAGRDLEQCPSDLVAVVCGQLHGWYSSSKDKILLLQQYAGTDQQQLPELQHLQMRQPPTAALPSAWVSRPVFVKLAGPRFSQKHSADAAINLLEPDGSKGVTLMALFRRQRRLADKEQQQQWHQQRHQGTAHQEQQLQAHGGAQEAVCLQQGASSSEDLTAPAQAAAAGPGPAGDPVGFADAGDHTTPSGAADAAEQGDAADAAADAEQQQPVQQSSSQWPTTASPVQQQNAIDLSADIAMVVCGPVKGYYSNSRDKVLLQEPYQGLGEQQGLQQQQQHSELLQAYPDPAAAPESLWLTRKGFMQLAGPQYCKNDSSRAIKMLLPDGALGTTMATYIKNRQDHLAALRSQAERNTRQQRQQEQQQRQQADQADLQLEGLASGRRSGRLQAVREYESGRRSSTPSAAAGGDAGTASGTGSFAEADSACSVPPSAAATCGAAAAAAAAAEDAGGVAAGQGVQGSLVPVVCGSVVGWYCSLRDQILPQQHQLERLLDPVQQQQQQGEAQQWVSKTFFMKMAAVQFWKCDSNKAIKLVAPDGNLGSTLGTFIKHERRRMWEQQQQQEPGEGLSMQDPQQQQQQVLLQANCNPEQLLQQQQLQARKAGPSDSSAEKRRFGRFAAQHGDTHSSMHTPAASGITSTEDDATEDPDYSEGPAAGGLRGSNHASSKPSRHRPAEQAAAAAAGAWSSEEHSPQHSAQPQHKAVPVMCGTAFGYYSSSRDEVLMLLKKHQQKGWTRVSALPNPKTLPGSYWVTKLAFKKLGGQQHQHDVLKAIKLLQPDGSLGVTLATFLKHERLQREQHEGMSPVLQTRRRQAATSSKHGRDGSNSSGHSTPEQSPGPPPAKKHCRRKAGTGGGAATAAKMAAQAAAHRRALAKIAALVGAAEAAELAAAAAEYDAGGEGDGGGSYADNDAAGAAIASGDAAANAAAAAADVQEGVVCAAAAAGDLGGSDGTGPDLSDMSAGTNASDSELMTAAAPDAAAAAAAGGVEAPSDMWLHAAVAADAACDTPDASEDDHSDDDVVAVACGSVQGWYSRSKDLVLLRQPGDAWEASETLDDSHEQQLLLAAQLAAAPDSSWLTKQSFKKLGGMQHQHDALKAVKLLQPDGSLGVTLATYLKHSKTQRQRRKQEAREQRRQGQQARLAAFLAAIDAALQAEGWGVQDVAVCMDAAVTDPAGVVGAAGEAAAGGVDSAAAADGMQGAPAAAGDAVMEGVQSAAAAVEPEAVDASAAAATAAAAASPMVNGSDAAVQMEEGAGGMTGLQGRVVASAAAAAAGCSGAEAALDTTTAAGNVADVVMPDSRCESGTSAQAPVAKQPAAAGSTCAGSGQDSVGAAAGSGMGPAGEGFMLVAAAALMQLNSDPLPAEGSDAAAAAAIAGSISAAAAIAGSISAAAADPAAAAAESGVGSESEQLPAEASAVGDSAGEPAAAAADTTAVVTAPAALAASAVAAAGPEPASAAGVASAAAAIAAARAESAAVPLVAAVRAVDRVNSGSADVTPGAADDLSCTAGAAAVLQQHMPVGYSAAIAAAAAAGSSAGGGSGGRDGYGADDQNPTGTDASRPAGSSKKRGPTGGAGHSCGDDLKRRKLGAFAAAGSPSATAAGLAAGAGDGVGVAAAAADVPLVQVAPSSTSMVLQEQAAVQAGVGSSFDLAPL